MNLLDENVIEEQRQLLQSWRISVHQIGYDIGRVGTQDEAIIPILHSLRRVTFFTMDSDFYKPNLCHARYCIAYLAVEEDEAAVFIRRFLRHKAFDTEAKRMGIVAQVSHIGLVIWRLHEERPLALSWDRSQR
jgi:hypothetical protein